ncbi:hypothetical protein Droror1_Dr00000263 [Drosera rotundifolia]
MQLFIARFHGCYQGRSYIGTGGGHAPCPRAPWRRSRKEGVMASGWPEAVHGGTGDDGSFRRWFMERKDEAAESGAGLVRGGDRERRKSDIEQDAFNDTRQCSRSSLTSMYGLRAGEIHAYLSRLVIVPLPPSKDDDDDNNDPDHPDGNDEDDQVIDEAAKESQRTLKYRIVQSRNQVQTSLMKQMNNLRMSRVTLPQKTKVQNQIKKISHSPSSLR